MQDKVFSIAPGFFFFSLLIVFGLFPPSTKSQTATVVDSANRERGINLYRKKNFVEAANVLKDVVKKSGADEEAWYYLGLALTQQPKELKNATKAFETAIKLRPSYAAAHTGLSYVLLRRNKFSDALHEAQTAIKLEPKLANAHHVVAVVRLNAGAFDDALASATEAIRLNPRLAAAYLVKSESLWGIYARPSESAQIPKRGRTKPTTETVTSPEEMEERRRKRKKDESILAESAQSLETYLKLNPSDPSAALWRQQLATLKVISNIGEAGAEVVKHGDEVTTKAIVLAKPEPAYTDEARGAHITGTVVLRAVFSANGTIRHILIVRGLPLGLTEQAVMAAQRIRFTPATVDGVPVSMFVQLEYNFHLY